MSGGKDRGYKSMRMSEKLVSVKTERYIKQLYYGREADRQIRKLGTKRLRMAVTVAAISLAVAIPVFVSDHERMTQPVTELARNGYGEGSRSVTVRAYTGDGFEEKMTIEVKERQYSDDELERFSKILDEKLWKEILGGNTDAGHVMENLDLKDHIEGYPFEISWRTDKPRILSGKGEIDGEELKKEDPADEGVSIRLCATIKYNGYTEDKYSYVIVRKRKETAESRLRSSIIEAIETSDGQSRNEEMMILPDTAGGSRIEFAASSVNKGWIVLFAGIMTVCIMMAVKDGRIKDKAERRRRQIEEDYPRILNQYALYHTAGMNPRAIWYEICRRYEQERADKRYGKRYAYEEMIAARNRMEEGCGELAAYDGFAARCDDVRFRSFASFVKQAVVTGGAGLGGILYEEMDKARRERIGRVKMAASEAETKLLLPMFMMLAVVLVIVMVPAFMSLN